LLALPKSGIFPALLAEHQILPFAKAAPHGVLCGEQPRLGYPVTGERPVSDSISADFARCSRQPHPQLRGHPDRSSANSHTAAAIVSSSVQSRCRRLLPTRRTTCAGSSNYRASVKPAYFLGKRPGR
jgi:hypothetical protein